MSTKGDIIDKAYSRARISGLTKIPSGEDVSLALDKLENMAALWEEKHIRTGYAFEDIPDPGSSHNLKRAYWSAYASNLALLLLADFGKDIHPVLAAEASSTFAQLSSMTATVEATNYPTRQPIGSGNRRYTRWNRYFAPAAEVKSNLPTVEMYINDIDTFTEHYDDYLLDSETLSSYTIINDDDGISISDDSLTSPDITYTLQAGNTAGVYKLAISVITSFGRKLTRVIYFKVVEEI